jgi:chromosome segregation ATPase
MSPRTSLALVLVARLLAGCAAFRRDPPRSNSTAFHALSASKGSSEATVAVAAINAVEQALAKLTSNPRMSPEMVAAAKQVTQEVDQAAKEIESGSSSKAEKMKLVGRAVTSLQSLQGKWEKAAKDALAKEKAAEEKETSAAARIATLKKELEQKKAMLAKDETMLKEAQMQKEILEKAEQAEGGSKEEARQQEAELASLEAMAKSMSSAPKAADKHKQHAQAHSKVPASLGHVVADLRARAKNLTAALERLDTEEKNREAELEKVADKQVPTQGKKDAIQQGQKVLTMLKKQAKRSYKKARAVKAAELAELNEAIGSIEKGDVKALSKLMAKMQHETKQLNAKSKNFLY